MFNITHVKTRTEDIFNGVVHWVIENTRDVILIRTDVSRISIEAFSHLENSRSCSKFTPKVFWNLWNGIDSNTVKTICSNQILNPVFMSLSDIRVALIEIREISEAAILDLGLVIPVRDLAV